MGPGLRRDDICGNGTMLSQKQVEQYRCDGYLFPFPALSAAELAESNAGLARFESWLGKPVNQGDFRWRSASYVILPWVDALARHPRILDAVEDLIGPDILVYTATWFIKEAQSPTFAAWHQDATYFGLDPHEHVTAWVALSEAGAEAGCMEVVSSQGRPRQMQHAALKLENRINGAGQAIVEPFEESGAAMMELPAGSFSLHHTLCRHRSAPNRANHRRVGIGISCIPPRWSATRRSTAATATITPSRSPRTRANSRRSRFSGFAPSPYPLPRWGRGNNLKRRSYLP